MVYKTEADADRVHIEEFRAKTIGAYSPGLQRILHIMLRCTRGDQYVLVCRKRFAEYVIGRMPPDRSEMIVIDDDMVITIRACQAVVEAQLQLKPVNRLVLWSWRMSATA